MGAFDAALRVKGDTRPIEARLKVEEGRLFITAADQPIGDWQLADLAFERTAAGFEVDVEGERLILELKDPAEFADAVATKPKGKLRTKDKKSSESTRPGISLPRRKKREPRPEQATANTRPDPAPAPPRPAQPAQKAKPAVAATTGAKILAMVDGWLDKAQKAYGSLLPEWVFTRMTVWLLAGFLIVMIVFPGVFSTVLLIGGFAIVVFGAVVYTDSGLAVRVLPGRATPTHVLIVGVGILVFGFLLAVVAP